MASILNVPARRRLSAILAAGLLSTAIASSASAATTPVSIKISSADLTARILVTVGVDFVCQPLVSAIDGSPVTSALLGLAVSVDQANGRTIAHAAGGDTMPSTDLVTCDGSTVNHRTMSLLSSTVPFHGGTAIATVMLNVDDPACSFCGSSEFGRTTSTVKLTG
jgi:hypothetical protein